MSRDKGAVISLKSLLMLFLTLGLFSILVNLGFWQLDRGDEKAALETQLEYNSRQSSLALEVVIKRDQWSWQETLGLMVEAEFEPTQLPLLLLDNQILNGEVGYLVFQIMRYQQHYMLLELGFSKASMRREQLPEIEQLTARTAMIGKLYAKQPNRLSSDLHPEFFEPNNLNVVRIQNLNIDAIGALFSLELLPVAIQPTNLTDWSMPFPWHPLPMSSAKHYGYAAQWFTMAFALVICVAAVIWCHRRRKI
ncbi:SURF1 family protein [Vibrio sp. SM6]|uniref:SURF1-like protein n=1 Tax=Vibrio agarilyticus TaxID=2726741 RepID=A0A7X8TSH9_9VIBR|nr:SURF1 family protein [Vibrio agarilyticus]NLS13801.1 SURF1 family protein [Vibrio agarilyticus]